MAKLQAYKFVNPGVASKSTPVALAARNQTLAINRLGFTVESLGRVVEDIASVSTLRKKNDQAQEIAERRAERRRKDAAAEELQESKRLQKEGKKKPKLSSGLKKGLGKSLGWIGSFLGPIGGFLLKIASFVAVKEMMQWAADPKNQEELATFVEKAQFVFGKLFGWASTLTKTTLDGFGNLFGSESTFGDRLKGVGQILLGVVGLKYLMNPFSLISDIFGILDLFGGEGNGRGRGSGTKPTKPTTTSGQRPVRPTSAQRAANARIRAIQRQHGPGARRIFENALKNGKTPTQANAAVNRALSRGQIVSRPAASSLSAATARPGSVFSRGLGRSANRFGLKLFGKAGLQGIKGIFGRIPIIGPIMVGIGSILAGEPIGQALFKAFGAAIGGFLGSFIPIPVLGTLLGEMLGTYVGDLLYTLFMGGGAEAVGKKLQQDMMKILETGKLVTDWVGRGLGRYFEGVPKVNIFGKKVPDVGWLINPFNVVDKFKTFHRAFFTDIPMDETKEQEAARLKREKEEREKAEKAKLIPEDGHHPSHPDDLNGDGHIDDHEAAVASVEYLKGGVVPRPIKKPQELFLGGVVKGISKAVSGIGNAVKNVVSNPIVQTAAAFIPGVGPIMGAVNMGMGLLSGDPMQMLSSAAGMIPGLGGALGGIGNAIGGVLNSPLGQIGTSLLSGNFMGAAMAGLNMIPGLGGLLSGPLGQMAGSLLSGNFAGAIGTGLGMIPGLGKYAGMAGDVIGGLLGGGGLGGALQTIAGPLANQFGLGGLYQVVTGFLGGNYEQGIMQLGGELGIDPKILGVASDTQKTLAKGGLSAEYAMQQAMEFIPVPVMLEKLVPLPTPVPINKPVPVVSAGATALTNRTAAQ